MIKIVTAFKVIPYRKNLEAPAIYVEAKSKKEALQEAKDNSGLARFKNWQFLIIPFKKRENNGKRR